MFSTPLYPIFLSLADQRCLIAGFGNVGQRKFAGLKKCRPRLISVFDPHLSDAIEREFAGPGAVFHRRRCEAADIRSHSLIYAATSDPDENSAIADICRQEGKLCNCAAHPDEGDFIVPAVARKHRLAAAISTGGASPLLAALCKQELGHWLEGKERLIWLMGRLRPIVLAQSADSGANAAFFKKLLASPLPSWLASGDLASCAHWLESRLPEAETGKILAEFKSAFPA